MTKAKYMIFQTAEDQERILKHEFSYQFQILTITK